MLDALLATIGTLGVLASLLAKRGNAGAGADTDTDAASCEPAAQDDRQEAAPAMPGRRRECRRRRVRARVARGTGQ
ncbi:MAG: hypothetical protein AB1584_12850 [Pseudomonadota bacterium]